MSIERLQMFREFVSEIPAQDLNVGGWCGCIGGRAARDERFQNLGLRTDEVGAGTPRYEDKASFAAMAAFLGITDAEAHDLFSNCGYRPSTNQVTREQVYAKLDKLMAAARVEAMKLETLTVSSAIHSAAVSLMKITKRRNDFARSGGALNEA